MTEPYVDLHLHSDYSDGTFTPTEIVARAQQAGLRCIALTDHDTMDGYAEAAQAAAARGVELLPALELSSLNGVECHILGYLVDAAQPALRATLAELRLRRVARITHMVERLQQAGVRLTTDHVLTIAGRGTVGRLHLARALVQCGAVRNTEEAFPKYLSPGRPGYVPEHKLKPAEAIALIRQVGGVPVLAHPCDLKHPEQEIQELCAAGLAGLEVFHSRHTASHIRQFTEIAKQQGLLMTGGSDCHGMAKGRPLLGTVKAPYRMVEELRAWQQQHA